jgi:nitroreductase
MADEIGLFEAMYTQRTLRRYKPDAVPDELVRRLVEAATKAPSGGNRQPWNFIVIRDAESKRKLGEWYRDAWDRTYGQIAPEQRAALPGAMRRVVGSAEHLAYHLAETPVLILACLRDMPVAALAGAAASSAYGSIFPAVQNLLLAARGLGLGAALTTLHKMHDAEVKELLGIPEGVETVALIPVGYPLDAYGPTTRVPVDKVLYYERWEGRAP